MFGSNSVPLQPGCRNQYSVGLQQSLGRWVIIDADYFWKYTRNAYDFSVLFNTPITSPIAWQRSKPDGVTARVSTVNIHGFTAYMTLGHSRARYFQPESGGLVPLGGFSDSVFRIDHDQAYQQTVVMRYQHKTAERIDFSWRYDSGLVVSGCRMSTRRCGLRQSVIPVDPQSGRQRQLSILDGVAEVERVLVNVGLPMEIEELNRFATGRTALDRAAGSGLPRTAPQHGNIRIWFDCIKLQSSFEMICLKRKREGRRTPPQHGSAVPASNHVDGS